MSDVIVVGAGPTVLTLACGRKAAGVDVRVLDNASGCGDISGGVGVVDRLGALGDLPDGDLPEPLSDVARERLSVVAVRGERGAQLVHPDGRLAWRGADAARLRAWVDNALGELGVLTP